MRDKHLSKGLQRRREGWVVEEGLVILVLVGQEIALTPRLLHPSSMLKQIALAAALLVSAHAASFTATINTDTGLPPIVFNITEELAPIGVARFKELVDR